MRATEQSWLGDSKSQLQTPGLGEAKEGPAKVTHVHARPHSQRRSQVLREGEPPKAQQAAAVLQATALSPEDKYLPPSSRCGAASPAFPGFSLGFYETAARAFLGF